MSNELLFDVPTPLDFKVRTSPSYWNVIVRVKHPIMFGQEDAVQKVLRNPDEVRISRNDNTVYLFYQAVSRGRWICAVAKRLNGKGFLVTAYPTDAIKEGVRVWPE